MKTMTPLQRSTVQMSVGVAILTAITEVIYVILCLALPSLSYTWKFTAGNIFMAGIMCVNFYLMARGIYHAVDMGVNSLHGIGLIKVLDKELFSQLLCGITLHIFGMC